MTRVIGRADTFAADALAGFCDVYAPIVRRVPGGVARVTAGRKGKVAVVVGGGSGHYPAFAGYVGEGLADAAVCGDVFASPSAAQVYEVAKAVERGGGILLTFGNYAGDVLNFGLGAERLRAEGIDVRVVAVTDDVASAPAGEEHRRRGVAGDVIVFKIAGAAADVGYDLDGVQRVATTVNDRTRSFGVAFAGCTLPGSAEPLFTVQPGVMALGLGVHGEPGIADQPLVPATELAAILTGKIMAETPESVDAHGPQRAAVLLNGLGATKYEELFVLWHALAPQLRNAGLDLVEPLVGEYVTSLDMAGCSLTIAWLDDETTRLWQAPAQTPALRRGAHIPGDTGRPVTAVGPVAAENVVPTAEGSDAYPAASSGSTALGALIASGLGRVVPALAEAEQELGRLDAVAGDGDHGRGMLRGARAAKEAATSANRAGAGARTVLAVAADAWSDAAGGTSGALWGSALRRASEHLEDTDADVDVVACVVAAADAIRRLGGAAPGDKTMVDALAPFAEVLATHIAAGADVAAAWRAAAAAAQEAAQQTAALSPRVGRARPLAARSIGHPDPGAVSFALVVNAAVAG